MSVLVLRLRRQVSGIGRGGYEGINLRREM